MIYTHERYEMLTALAATGQISDSELSDLAQHTRECVSCREGMAEMEQLSRELFLTHANNTTRSSLPAGMEQRFQERARRAGVPVRRPIAVSLSSGFLRLALVTSLLVICFTLSWKRLSAPSVSERAVIETDSSVHKMANPQQDPKLPIAKERLLSTSPQRRQPSQRKALSQRQPVNTRFRNNEMSQTSFVLSRPSSLRHDYERTFSDNTSTVPMTWNQDSVTTGLHLSKRKAFDLAYVPNIWGAADRQPSDQRTFHYNPNLASLSFLDGSQASGMTAIPALNINRSQFHLDVSKTW